MGYEVKLYLGEARSFSDESTKWFQTVATVDLAKPYGDLAAFAETKTKEGEKVYIYASDGNTQMTEDCYGMELIAVPAEQVLKLMQREAKRNRGDYDGKGYRRYNMAFPLL